MDPSDGTVLASFPTYFSVADGIGYAGDLLYITRGTQHVTKFTTSGEHAGYTALDDMKGEEGFSADRSHDALHMYWPVSGAAGSATHVFWIGVQVYTNHFMYYTPLPTPGFITWPPTAGRSPRASPPTTSPVRATTTCRQTTCSGWPRTTLTLPSGPTPWMRS